VDKVAGVQLHEALERKYPNAGKEWAWQWVFPFCDSFSSQARREMKQYKKIRHRTYELEHLGKLICAAMSKTCKTKFSGYRRGEGGVVQALIIIFIS